MKSVPVHQFHRRIVSALSTALCVVLIASAGQASANTAPPVYGQTIGNWGHAWWQWALNFPEATNPLLQDGPVDCSAGQSGKVWFLAGTFGGSAERTCSIRSGRALLIPLLNAVSFSPEFCAEHQEGVCRTDASAFIDTLTNWTCTVDGVPCAWFTQIVRAQSAARPLNLPAGAIGDTLFGLDPGVRKLSIADGYWVMLDPLPAGQHTIRVSSAASGFSMDLVYHLTVGP